MAIRDYIIYWTDDFNPPRHLKISAQQPDGEFPMPELRQSILADDPRVDIIEMRSFNFSTSWFGYHTTSGLTLATTEEIGLFAELPLNTFVGFGNIKVEFRKRGMRSNVGYSVSTDIPGYEDTAQSQGFDYNGLCAVDPEDDPVLEATFNWPNGYAIWELTPSNSPRVRAGRINGGFIIYFPCNWSVPRSITYRQVRIRGSISIPKNVNYVYNPQVRTAVYQIWPQAEEDDG